MRPWCQPPGLWLTPTTMHSLGARPPSRAIARHQPTVGYQPPPQRACLVGDRAAAGKKACQQLHLLGGLKRASSSLSLACTILLTCTGPSGGASACCWPDSRYQPPMPCTQMGRERAHQQPGPLLKPEPVVAPGPHHYACVCLYSGTCSWPLQWHGCTPPAPVTTTACTGP